MTSSLPSLRYLFSSLRRACLRSDSQFDRRSVLSRHVCMALSTAVLSVGRKGPASSIRSRDFKVLGGIIDIIPRRTGVMSLCFRME